MLEEIMAWLTGAEATLTAAEGLPDPKEIASINALLQDHRCALRKIDTHDPVADRLHISQKFV